MASGGGQSNPSTSEDAGWDHNEDYGNEYGPPLPTQEELREMEHRRFVGEATNMMLNFAKDPKLAKYMTETAFQDVHAQWKATTTSPPKPDSKKQYSKKKLEEVVETRLARILGVQDKSKKHDKKRKKSTDFPGYLGNSSEEDRKGKKRNKKQRHKKGKKKMRNSNSRRVDDSSTEDTSTDSSDSEDGHFYANKKNFYKANQYDFLEDKSKKVREFKEGGQSIKFDTFAGYKDASKALSFIQQFDIAFARRRYSEHSKIRRAASYLKGNARTWWSTLLLNKTVPVKWLKFKKLFISSWLMQEYEPDIRAAWNHLRMTKGDTVEVYCERFWSAFLPASSFKKISFREQIERFTLGLPTEIRDHCLEQKRNRGRLQYFQEKGMSQNGHVAAHGADTPSDDVAAVRNPGNSAGKPGLFGHADVAYLRNCHVGLYFLASLISYKIVGRWPHSAEHLDAESEWAPTRTLVLISQ
ncbi:hypothetical protein L7F22_065486 [Adiantum nelumboides]|nr:hypothetical protein [Adiantum nelumboides]